MFIEGLTNLIGSNGKYLINNDGQIKDIKGNDIPVTRDSEGHKVVTCLGWAGHQEYRVIDLMALQFKNLQIPVEDYDKVIAFVIDGNKDNAHASNIGYRFKGGKLEFKKMPGFYYIPGFPYITINENGVVINIKTLQKMAYQVTPGDKNKNVKGGYSLMSSRFGKGERIVSSRHRFMCLTFKEYPDNVDSLTVNHINGIPGDDRIENLEWSTRGQNNMHAVMNGLKTQNMHVLVRNVLTGEVTEYCSITECSRKLGYSGCETIRHRIKVSKFGQVFQDGTQIKLKSDPRPWVETTDAIESIKKADQRVAVMVRDCKDLSIKKCCSIQEASDATNVKWSTIDFRLRAANLKPCFGYQFKYDDGSMDFPEFTQFEYLHSLRNNSTKIHARDLIGGSELIFDSGRKAEEHFARSNISDMLRCGKQPIYSDGWQFKYDHQEWEEVKDVEKTLYECNRDAMARCEKTGKVYIGSSCKELAQLFNLDPISVKQAAMSRGNKVFKDYRFRLGVSSDPWPTTDLPSQ